MGWLTKNNPSKVAEAKKRMQEIERKLRLSAHFQDLDVTVDFVGSTEFKQIRASYVHGDIRWRDAHTPEEHTIIFENDWKKGAAIERHLHAVENKHIFLTTGRLEVQFFEPKRNAIVLPEAPYIYIPAGTPHKVTALSDSAFLCTFEPWQSK